MMPKLHSTNHAGMELIRPMYMIREENIINWCRYNDLHFIQCACRFTEHCTISDNAGGGSKRQEMKQLVKRFRNINPHIEMNIFKSVHNVNLDTIIGYHNSEMEHNFLDDYEEKGRKKREEALAKEAAAANLPDDGKRKYEDTKLVFYGTDDQDVYSCGQEKDEN